MDLNRLIFPGSKLWWDMNSLIGQLFWIPVKTSTISDEEFIEKIDSKVSKVGRSKTREIFQAH